MNPTTGHQATADRLRQRYPMDKARKIADNKVSGAMSDYQREYWTNVRKAL